MSDVHDAERLKELQSLPLNRKIQITQTRIIEWYQHYQGNVCISFSGGKDSTVLLHIARQIYPDIKAVFSNTGLEYPEIKEFVKGFDNVDIVTPSMNFGQVITQYGYPLIGKEVAEAIYYARRIRSQNVQVERERERERTGERKRTELQGNRAKADGTARKQSKSGRCCKQSGSGWNLGESDRNTHRDEHIEKRKDNAPGQDVQTARNRGSEWKDWRRGCL